MLRLVQITDELPAGFDIVRAEAQAEGYRHLERLAADWASCAMRFNGAGEALLAATVEGVLAGIGGLTIEPAVPDAFRMRRFYVRPRFRRQGVGRKLAEVLVERPLSAGRLVTVNAGSADAPAFWATLGFTPDARDGYTHILRCPPS
jgi:GNAT superfamily N-acetyltransferase